MRNPGYCRAGASNGQKKTPQERGPLWSVCAETWYQYWGAAAGAPGAGAIGAPIMGAP